VSNIVIEVSGSGTGDGFLIAPDNGHHLSVPLSLSTNDGSTVSATIDATPNGGGIAVPGGSISIGPSPTVLHIFATAASASRGDTVINVHVGAVETSFSLTAISSPQIGFQGRFEARFATDGDYYNDARGSHGTGTASGGTTGSIQASAAPAGPGRSKASLTSSRRVPSRPVSRTRLRSPLDGSFGSTTQSRCASSPHLWRPRSTRYPAPRPRHRDVHDRGPGVRSHRRSRSRHVSRGQSADQSGGSAARRAERGGVRADEPLRVSHQRFFSGESANLTDRPTANNVVDLDAAEKAIAQFIDPATGTAKPYFDQATFEAARLMQLQNAYNALTPADRTGTVAGRNLKTRIDMISASTTLPQGWSGKEEYTGKVNAGIAWQPNAWAVMEYFAGYTDFTFFGKLFTFSLRRAVRLRPREPHRRFRCPPDQDVPRSRSRTARSARTS